MATSRLISSHLRRSRFSLLHPFSLLKTSAASSAPHHSNAPPPLPTNSSFTFSPAVFFPSTSSSRYFSSRPSDAEFTHAFNSVTESELRSLGYTDGAQVSGVLEDSILPIKAAVSLLDGYHDLTGLPWWIIIASSTLALRIMLLPWLILQLRKLKQIGELFPKLPPPFPPPFSGKSFRDQFSLFRSKRKELECPSFLWFLGSYTVQLPCFILAMATIRSMSLAHHPGFETGGILWFHNLTELPNGVYGPILPILIAGLHFCNIQISFRSASVGNGTGMFDLLARYYRKYLELLTLPLLYIGFCIPQGSLVYWVTNSSLTLIQQLALQHPTIRQKLGLPDREALQRAADREKDKIRSGPLDAPKKQRVISAFSLSPAELVEFAIGYLAKGNEEKATPLLRLALDKDPEYSRAWMVLGQVMFQKGLYDEATEYADSAISQISLLEQPTDGETVDTLIQASLVAAASLYRQGKVPEALVHFERVRDMAEPEYPPAKARYYEGLVVLASVLADEGRKDEAAQYLRMAVAYDPRFNPLLENLENDTDNFVGGLVNSRRGDY